MRALVIHEIVRRQGEEELRRPSSALAASGFAAGLSMGFSFLVMAFLIAHLPDAPWRPLVANLGYASGFIIVILGSQQLFTETTLTAVLPLFTKPSRATFVGAARVWGVVLVANLAGTWLFAVMLSLQGIFPDPVWQALGEVSGAAAAATLFPSVMKAVMAGWLIALMVWLLPSAGSARLFIILLLTYVVALGVMPHAIAGSVEAAFRVTTGEASVQDYVLRFLIPTVVGNSVGGVALTALLNHAPVAAELSEPS